MVCVPGHGRGVDDIVGIDDQGRDRTDKDGYQHDFAIQVVEHGMAAVAIEPMAFGCRRDPMTQKKGLGVSACQPVAGAALLLGQTMIGWRVWDVMRTIDWIETRPELDAKRVGCMGISGGGTCTLFSAALEPRIRAAMVSGYLNTFRDCIMSLSHCIDNYVPGILNWAEMYDVAGLIAPRPLFAESGERDDFPDRRQPGELRAGEEGVRSVRRGRRDRARDLRRCALVPRRRRVAVSQEASDGLSLFHSDHAARFTLHDLHGRACKAHVLHAFIIFRYMRAEGGELLRDTPFAVQPFIGRGSEQLGSFRQPSSWFRAWGCR